jgi:hypothetical protein
MDAFYLPFLDTMSARLRKIKNKNHGFRGESCSGPGTYGTSLITVTGNILSYISPTDLLFVGHMVIFTEYEYNQKDTPADVACDISQ